MAVRTALAAALLLAATGCTADDTDPASSPGERTTETPSETAPESPASTEPETSEPSSAGSPTDTTAGDRVALLDWQDTGEPVDARVTVGDEWRVAVDRSRTTAELTGPTGGLALPAGPRRRFSEVLLDDEWAVLVAQDRAESRPSVARVVELATGDVRRVVTPEPASGGSWAMADGSLWYPTTGDGGAYCLATLALADSNGEDGWCAEPRTGWSGLTASSAGVGMMTFDDRRPVACRTVDLVDGSGLPQPVAEAEPCTGWDVAATETGAIWSVVPRARRQEEATFHATSEDGVVDLGAGTTGSLVPCGDSVFFVRDPQDRDDPARLMRWTAGPELEIAYESRSRGNAFLGEPVCSGDVLTLSSYGQDGDEQVWARVD